MRIALLFCFLFGAPAFTSAAPSMPFEAATLHASSLLSHIKDRAKENGIELTNQQMLFARDILIGYYKRSSHAQKANIVWLRVPDAAKASFEVVLKLVTDFLDPEHGAEHLRLETYKILEPHLLEQKLREQKKHLVILDDFEQLFGPQSIPTDYTKHFEIVDTYWEWILKKAPARLTLFVIDENGLLIRDPAFAGHVRLDFVGTNYGANNILEDGETIDFLGSEVIHLKDCSHVLRSWH
jgi:hypothetical protein